LVRRDKGDICIDHMHCLSLCADCPIRMDENLGFH
jgi:hypothetical protein